MNVSLTSKLEELVNKKVASGRYNSASEVIREALRLLEERDQLREMRLGALHEEIELGLKDLEEGRVHVFDAKFLEEIKQRGREQLAAQRRRKPK